MGFDHVWYGPSWGSRCGQDGPTEFSWGEGMVPPGAESAPPRDGGMYRGRSSDMTEPPRRKPRRSDPPRGYPGDIVAQ